MGTRRQHLTSGRLGQYAVLADDDTTTQTPAAAEWEGVIGVEGTLTGDGRLIEPGALRWETPFPIRIVRSDVGGHDGAEVAGTCTHLERRDGGVLWGRGPLDMGGEAGREAYRVLEAEVMNGISMDLDDVAFEIRVAGELLADGEAGEGPPAEDVDEEGRVTVVRMDPDDEVMVTTGARVRAATLVAIPAFIEARIGLADTVAAAPPVEDSDEVTASAAPVRPPRDWFANPQLPGPTPFTVTPEGRVYGHLALWGTCHVTHAMQGECLEPPSSTAGYAHFRTGAVLCDDGTEVAVGRVTVNTTHPDTRNGRMTPEAVTAHYDNTGAAAAYVAAGEDQYGIWVAGTVKPGATDAQVDVLRASPLSGDWRRVGNSLELVAVLAVNGPGFPVPRPAGLVASGRLVALTASSGMLPPPRAVTRDDGGDRLSDADIAWLKHMAARERTQHADQLAVRVRRAKAAVAERKVRAFAARRHGRAE